MSVDLILKPSCGVCGSTQELYGSTCKHLTLCVSCGKNMAERRSKCYECGTPITRLIRESAKGAVDIARKKFPEVECKWGDAGLDEIIKDSSIIGVAVVLAGQTQVEMSLRLLKEGKHVLQAMSEVESALSSYHSFSSNLAYKPFWAVAENYRFEPAFVEGKKLMTEIGDIMNIQLIVEGSMNSSNPYFSSSWRRNFTYLLFIVLYSTSLDEGNTEKSHGMAVAALQAADEYLKESKKACEAFNMAVPLSSYYTSCGSEAAPASSDIAPL